MLFCTRTFLKNSVDCRLPESVSVDNTQLQGQLTRCRIQALNRLSSPEHLLHQHLPFSLPGRVLYFSSEQAAKDTTLSKLSDQENCSNVQKPSETSYVMVKYYKIL